MIQSIPKLLTFDEFVAWYPENSPHRYELHNRVIVEMPNPTGDRSDVTGFISLKLAVEIDGRQLPYSIPGDYLLKPVRNEAEMFPVALVCLPPAIAKSYRLHLPPSNQNSAKILAIQITPGRHIVVLPLHQPHTV